MVNANVDIARCFTDRRLIAAALDEPRDSWTTWVTVLKAAFGLSLTADELELFHSVAGNRTPPKQRCRELWCIIGRRGGKSRIAAALAVFFACFIKYPKLARGERGMVLVIAGTIEQALAVFDYIRGFLEASPVLRKEIAAVSRYEITLKSGIVLAVHSNSFRRVRGRTLCACIFDEVAFWRDESTATPDTEVYTAVLPALITTGGMLVGISSPYRRTGLLHNKWRHGFGVDLADTLVVTGSSTTFNPSLTEDAVATAVEAQRQADPTASRSEWDAEFRNDIATFLDDALIDAAVEHGRPLELPPVCDSYRYYKAFCDTSGGTGHDSYTLAIGHKQGDQFVIDVVRGTTGKFDPVEVTKAYTALLREYGCSEVTGDAYAAEWVAGAWRSTGIGYVKSDTVKSQIYLNCIPLFTRGLVRLPDHPKLLRELRLLERQAHRGGKESVDHPKNGHDDYANAVCGVLHGLSLRLGYDTQYRAFSPDYRDPDARPAAEQPPAANQGVSAAYYEALERESWERYCRAQRGER